MRKYVLGVVTAAIMFVTLPPGAFQPRPALAQDPETAAASDSPYYSFAGPVFTLPQWTDGAGWTAAEYYSTIQTADINHDGAAEHLARSSHGTETWRWTGTDWTELNGDSPAFTDKAHWDKPEYYQTIQTGDIDSDGAAELLARSSAGMNAYKWNGTSLLSLATANPDWSDAGGWNEPQYYATIQTGDVNGDGPAELIARTSKGIDTYQWTGKAWTSKPGWSCCS